MRGISVLHFQFLAGTDVKAALGTGTFTGRLRCFHFTTKNSAKEFTSNRL